MAEEIKTGFGNVHEKILFIDKEKNLIRKRTFY